MADAHEALGQDVLQEAPNEFFTTEAQGLVLAAGFVVLSCRLTVSPRMPAMR